MLVEYWEQSATGSGFWSNGRFGMQGFQSLGFLFPLEKDWRSICTNDALDKRPTPVIRLLRVKPKVE